MVFWHVIWLVLCQSICCEAKEVKCVPVGAGWLLLFCRCKVECLDVSKNWLGCFLLSSCVSSHLTIIHPTYTHVFSLPFVYPAIVLNDAHLLQCALWDWCQKKVTRSANKSASLICDWQHCRISLSIELVRTIETIHRTTEWEKVRQRRLTPLGPSRK